MSEVLASSAGPGRAAAEQGRWRDAYAAYSEADRAELSTEDLELFAQAAWWNNRVDLAIELRGKAFAEYSAAGDIEGAVRVALALSEDHLGRGAFAISHGWFAKAERLIETIPESREHASFLLTRGGNALRTGGDPDAAIADLDRAFELARRFRDRDVEASALGLKGHALVMRGDVDEGLALLDEASAAAVCGELRAFAAGFVYCCTISSCQDVGDYRRAAEWTEAANRWCNEVDLTGFPGVCRIHRAQIMRLRGDWPAAEAQAAAACDEVQDFDMWSSGAGFYEVGEIRRQRGDFAAAAEAYRKADEMGFDPQPGVALLRLAEGRVDSAVAAIRRALGDKFEPLPRLRLLPAQVEIAIAAGDLRTARTAIEELKGIVDAYKIGGAPAPAFDAALHFATGQVALAEGDPDAAIRCLRRAREDWQKVGAPYETARARTMLGVAYRRQGDEDGAMAEFEAALPTFERLGAKLDEERAKELLGKLETRRTFLFTDIVDSTKLLETLGDEKWKKLLGRHDELVRARIADSGGEVIKQTGDGFFASFDHAKGAIEAAIAIQRALDAEVVAPDVRIGVHTGGAFHAAEDYTDYGGQGVHVAARIGAAARAREILVSQETLTGLSGAFRVVETHDEALKGFDQPVSVASIDWR